MKSVKKWLMNTLICRGSTDRCTVNRYVANAIAILVGNSPKF
jgi:hypothetical protein